MSSHHTPPFVLISHKYIPNTYASVIHMVSVSGYFLVHCVLKAEFQLQTSFVCVINSTKSNMNAN